MAPRQKSIVRVAQRALTRDDKARNKFKKAVSAPSSKTLDSFTNFAHNLGIGTDSPLSSASYGFNPITRNRVLLEWIHRGSWLGGVAVDVIAEDMTRAGAEVKGEIEAEDIERIESCAKRFQVWERLNSTLKWSRLFGGAIAVILIDGQDHETPLRIESIRKDQFRGLLVLDRWMVEPSLSDLVQTLGPDLGLPKFYRVTAQAPALSGQRVHHSRCIRLEGIELPYQQRLIENLWGLSVLERLYDRMVAFDSATTGAAQLVYKSYIRTYKIENLREIVAAGGKPMQGLTAYVDMMRRFQGIEGMTLLDAKDDFSADSHGAFSGLSDALAQFGQQVSGAIRVPLVRLFGQSPTGFSTGETDLQNYYDGINSEQEAKLGPGVLKVYRCMAASEGVRWPEGARIKFRSLWQMSDEQKANIANTVANAVSSVEGSGLISRPVALRELRQSAEVTGIFSNITEEDIDEAEAEGPPLPEGGPLEAPGVAENGAAQGQGLRAPGEAGAAVDPEHAAQPVAAPGEGASNVVKTGDEHPNKAIIRKFEMLMNAGSYQAALDAAKEYVEGVNRADDAYMAKMRYMVRQKLKGGTK